MDAEAVVRSELGAWSSLDVEAIMSWFAADAECDFGYAGRFSGYDAIRTAVTGFVGRMTSCNMEIVNLAVADDVVLTERIDHVTVNGKTIDLPIMGAFEVEVEGDKISAWRDYSEPVTP
jgi:limonene-1,2-epoxide hydrolase